MDVEVDRQERVLSEAIFRANESVEPEKIQLAYVLMGIAGASIRVEGFDKAIKRLVGQDIFIIKDKE